MKADVDPRLEQQIAQAADGDEVEAMLLLQDGAPGAGPEAAEGLIDRVSRELKERPARVRRFPRLGAVYVKGSARLVRRLLESGEVSSASANDAQVTAGA